MELLYIVLLHYSITRLFKLFTQSHYMQNEGRRVKINLEVKSFKITAWFSEDAWKAPLITVDGQQSSAKAQRYFHLPQTDNDNYQWIVLCPLAAVPDTLVAKSS